MKKLFFICMIMSQYLAEAQKEVLLPPEKEPYDKKEEIIYDGKRYRVHNNYFTIGGGVMESSIRDQSQKTVGADYQFHIRRQQFQIGAMMSGQDFFGNNNTQVHLGYGYRVEKNTSNLAGYIGPTYFSGVTGYAGSPPDYYTGFGAYFSLQAVYKFVYDIGLGVELFGDVSYKQSTIGIKVIVFFSGSYRGLKRKYNPNVHSERQK